MIARYTRPAMGRIWEDHNKFQIWLDIEILACEAQADLGVIPREAVEVIRAKATFDVGRIDEIDPAECRRAVEERFGSDSFVRAHEAWAAPIVFCLAFGESLAFLSLLIPACAALVASPARRL